MRLSGLRLSAPCAADDHRVCGGCPGCTCHDVAPSGPVQCQGCGHVSYTARRDQAHNCWRNEDGTYEEGGTYQ